MIRKILLLALFQMIFPKIQAQPVRDSSGIILAAYDSLNHVYLIPDSIFNMRGRLLYMPYKLPENPIRIYGINLRWSSKNIDGTLMLSITKRQIYLRSEHNNPNPDYLYWFCNLDTGMFTLIVKRLNSLKIQFREYARENDEFRNLHYRYFQKEAPFPVTWTDADQLKTEKDRMDKKYRNTAKLIRLINEGLAPGKKIIFPAQYEFEKNREVKIVELKEDLADMNTDLFMKARSEEK